MTLDDALARLRAAKSLLDRYGVQRVGERDRLCVKAETSCTLRAFATSC